jgi:hypothetical protein
LKLTNDGLSLWYGTPDAPVPFDHEVVPRDAASLILGAHPANPTNSILVHYRVDGGLMQTVPGHELRVDHDRNCQYFGVRFPRFSAGDVVEYSPVLSCGGRRVPPPGPNILPSKFRLGPTKVSLVRAKSSQRVAPVPTLAPELVFLATITVHFDRVEYVGETPEGVRIDFYANTGSVSGPRLAGSVLAGAADHMYVRPDGMGVLHVRFVIATTDGAKLEVEDAGTADFGSNGYAKALANNLPSETDVVISPRLLTGHPKYVWLNRLQCLGVGRTNLDEARVDYQLYSVRIRTLTRAP